MVIRTSWTAAVAGLLPAAGGARAAVRPPMIEDITRCITAAGNSERQTGTLRLTLMVRRDGTLYAAYAHATHGIDNRTLQRCITNQSLVWTFDPAEAAYERPYVVHIQSHAVVLPTPTRTPPPEPLDTGLAQATLDLDDKATPQEQAAAYVDVKEYAKAIPLVRNATDVASLATL